MTDITATDLADQVSPTIDDSYDGAAIVATLIDIYGLVDLDTIPADEYWAIVERHHLGEQPDEVDRFRAEVVAAVQGDVPTGQSAAWRGQDVTLEIYGMSRHAPTLPGWARLTICTPDHQTRRLHGESTTWRQLHDAVSDAAAMWRQGVDEQLARAERLHWDALRAHADRDNTIRALCASGVTKYKIAKRLGVHESTIARIVGRA